MKHFSMRGRRWALTAIAVATAAALTACGARAPVDDGPRVLRVAVTADPTGPDAWDLAQGAANFVGGLTADTLFEGLGYWDYAAAELVPVLAESFEVAEDGLSIDVALRTDVDVTGGTHLDARLVVDYYAYVLGSDGYLLKGLFDIYESRFEVTGEYAFTISTAVPIYMPASFCQLLEILIVNPGSIGDPGAMSAPEPVGSGPYVIGETELGSSRTYVRNPDYRDPSAFPYDEITLVLIEDPVAQLNALKSGQVDVTAALTPELGVEAEAAGFVAHSTGGVLQSLNLRDPDNAKTPALRDVRVRQALAYAFDRDAIVENLFHGFGEPATQAYVPGQAEYVEDEADRYGYDLDKARDLMTAAGYPDGFDLTIATLTGVTADIEPIVVQALADIGIRVTLDTSADLAVIWGPEYDISIGFGESIHNTTYLLDADFGALGRPFLPTPEVTELLARIRGGDAAESAEASQELGRFLLDELWYIPIVTRTDIVATTSDVDITRPSARLRDFSPVE